jgi:hypothetical protein
LNGDNSPMEANLPRKACQVIFEKLKNGSIPSSDLFDGVEKHILENLSDTYGRFSTSSEYEAYKRRLATQTELLEG